MWSSPVSSLTLLGRKRESCTESILLSGSYHESFIIVLLTTPHILITTVFVNHRGYDRYSRPTIPLTFGTFTVILQLLLRFLTPRSPVRNLTCPHRLWQRFYMGSPLYFINSRFFLPRIFLCPVGHVKNPLQHLLNVTVSSVRLLSSSRHPSQTVFLLLLSLFRL